MRSLRLPKSFDSQGYFVRQLDSFSYLSKLAPNQVDFYFTDPPYCKQVHHSSSHRTERNGFRNTEKIDFDPLSSYSHILDGLRISRRFAVAFCSQQQVGKYSELCEGIARSNAAWWVKPNRQPQFTADGPGTPGESIFWAHIRKQRTKAMQDLCDVTYGSRVKQRWNGPDDMEWKRGIIYCPKIHHAHRTKSYINGKERFHTTEKPLALIMPIIESMTDQGDVVLDPFCGTGVIGHACILLGRKYIGFDVDPFWVAVTKERLSRIKDSIESGKPLERDWIAKTGNVNITL